MKQDCVQPTQHKILAIRSWTEKFANPDMKHSAWQMKPAYKIRGQPGNCYKQNDLSPVFVAPRSTGWVKVHMFTSREPPGPCPQKWAKLTSSTHWWKSRPGKGLWLLFGESTWCFWVCTELRSCHVQSWHSPSRLRTGHEQGGKVTEETWRNKAKRGRYPIIPLLRY